jgi:hypothetical protein
MAKLLYLGTAQARVQVSTVTIGGTWGDTETVTIKIGGKSVTYTCSGTPTAATVAAGLQALAAASTDPEFRELVWTVNAAVITATGAVAGVPVTIGGSEVSSSGTITLAVVTAATGPNHWDNADNWSTGAVPVNSDEVFFEANVAALYGLPSSGLTLAKFIMRAGRIGLPDTNASGYAEYRPTRAVFSCVDVQLGISAGVGPQLCRLDLSTSAAKVVVFGVSGAQSGMFAPVDVVVNSASAEVAAISGSVAVAPSGDETTTVLSCRCGKNATMLVGAGVTVTNLLTAGQTRCLASVTNLTVDDGTCTLAGAATVAELVVRGGTFVHNSTGTITDAVVGPGTFDGSQDIRARTVTDLEVQKGGVYRDPYNAITVTNGIVLGDDADQLVAS